MVRKYRRRSMPLLPIIQPLLPELEGGNESYRFSCGLHCSQADPTGNFIRNWIPELRKLYGPGQFIVLRLGDRVADSQLLSDLHNPSGAVADKLGYPRPIIPHNEARERALRRYKNPGEA